MTAAAKRACRLCDAVEGDPRPDDANFPCAWAEDDLCAACWATIEDDGFITVWPPLEGGMARQR